MSLNIHPDEAIAQIAYEAMRAYAETIGEGNYYPQWDKASEGQRACALKCTSFLLDNPGADQEDFHNDWVKRKREVGWSYGPVKDIGTLEHPALVPYEKLNPALRAKMAIFARLVEVMS